ncbi:MAG: DUF7305 domain-containing protein, partial [Planctomycetota bacterium]
GIRVRKGMVLPLIVTLGVILAILGIGLLQLGFGSRLISTITTAGISARTAADAGLTHAVYEMNRRFQFGVEWDNSWLPYSSGQVLLDNTDASFTYTIQSPVTDPTSGASYWEIISTGTSNRQKKTVHARVGVTNLFDYAVIVNESIVLKAGTLIDAYDSTSLYDPTVPSPFFMIGTNSIESPPAGGITLNNGVVIKGDVLVGVGGNPEEIIKDHGAATGNRYALATPFEFENIPVPVTPPSLGTLNVAKTTIGDGGVTVVKYDNIVVPTGGILDIEGEVHLHITGDLTLHQGAEMRVLQGSSAQIYLDGDLVGGNSNGINNMTLVPGNLRIFGTSTVPQKWTIQNSGEFYGVYYAPMADIIFKANADLFGSVSGHSFDLRNTGNMHYDTRLRELTGFDTGFRIDRWWEE